MIDAFTLELIKGNPDLKNAYEAFLLQDFKVRELNAKSNYKALKDKVNQTKTKQTLSKPTGQERF